MSTVDRQLRLLAVLGDALSDTMTLDEVGAAVLGHVAMLDASAGSLFLLEGDVLMLEHSWGFPREVTEAWRALPLSADTPISQCARSGEAVVVASRVELAEGFGHVDAAPRPDATWVAKPLRLRDQVLGVLGLRIERQVVDEARVLFLRRVAAQIASALHRARTFRQLEHAAEVEERLLATLSHDLRTPLGAVTMGAAFLEQRLTDPIEREAARRIHSSGRRAAELVASVLAFSRNRQAIERHRLPWMSLSPVVGAQVDELQTAFPEALLVVRLRSTAQVQAEPVGVGQVVANLVRNALQHGDPRCPVEVTISDTPDHVVLEVVNEGETVPASLLRRLFEPFERGRGDQAGAGLGLFIVKQLVERCGGDVAVASEAGLTTFTVRWPRR